MDIRKALDDLDTFSKYAQEELPVVDSESDSETEVPAIASSSSADAAAIAKTVTEAVAMEHTPSTDSETDSTDATPRDDKTPKKKASTKPIPRAREENTSRVTKKKAIVFRIDPIVKLMEKIDTLGRNLQITYMTAARRQAKLKAKNENSFVIPDDKLAAQYRTIFAEIGELSSQITENPRTNTTSKINKTQFHEMVQNLLARVKK